MPTNTCQALWWKNRTNPAVAKLIDEVRYEVNNPVLSLSGVIEQLKQWDS